MNWNSFCFWFSVGMIPANMVVLFVAKNLNDKALMDLALVSMLACVFGAGVNWYLDRQAGRGK